MATTDPAPIPDEVRTDWSAALATHGRWLRAVVRTRLGSRRAEVVDEIMQDVAVAAVTRKQPLEQPSQLAAWLYRVTVRQVLLHRRRWGRRHHLMERYTDVVAEQAADGTDTPGPLEWLLAEERAQLVREAIAELPVSDRDALLMRYAEDRSYREIAHRLGMTESAVESRLHRARERLRSRLGRHECFSGMDEP